MLAQTTPPPLLVLCEAEDDVALVNWVAARGSVTGLVVRSVDTWRFSRATLLAHVQDPVFGGETPPIVAVFDADREPHLRRAEIQLLIGKVIPDCSPAIYLLPDDESPGELEDLFLAAVRDRDLLACADAYAECVESRMRSGARSSKVRYQAYSAPIRYRRRAIEHAVFDDEIDWANPMVQKLATFLRRVRAAHPAGLAEA